MHLSVWVLVLVVISLWDVSCTLRGGDWTLKMLFMICKVLLLVWNRAWMNMFYIVKQIGVWNSGNLYKHIHVWMCDNVCTDTYLLQFLQGSSRQSCLVRLLIHQDTVSQGVARVVKSVGDSGGGHIRCPAVGCWVLEPTDKLPALMAAVEANILWVQPATSQLLPTVVYSQSHGGRKITW